MPLFGKSREKLDFYFLIHNLSPFPSKYRSLYIAWQRGASKEGRTKTVASASDATERAWATFQFEEAFHVDCALSQVASGFRHIELTPERLTSLNVLLQII